MVAICYDVLKYDYQASDAVRKLRMQCVVLDGQGVDAKKEEAVLDLKKMCASNTEISIRFATLFRQLAPHLRANAFAVAGKRDKKSKKTGSRHRSTMHQ